MENEFECVDGIYGGDELKKRSKRFYSKLLNGSPEKYWKKYLVKSIIIGILIGLALIMITFAVNYIISIFTILGGDDAESVEKVQKMATVSLIIGSIIVSIANIIYNCHIFKSRKGDWAMPTRIGGYGGLKHVSEKYANFGQSKYEEDYSKKMRHKILTIGFPIIISIAIIALFVDLIFIPNIIELQNTLDYVLLFSILKCVFVGMFNSLLWLFFFYKRDPIAAVTCPECHFVNTYIKVGEREGKSWHYEMKTGSTTSGEHKTHSIYVDGKEVGGIYGRHCGYDYYEYGTATEHHTLYVCAKCGNKAETTYDRFKKEGERSQINDR